MKDSSNSILIALSVFFLSGLGVGFFLFTRTKTVTETSVEVVGDKQITECISVGGTFLAQAGDPFLVSNRTGIRSICDIPSQKIEF